MNPKIRLLIRGPFASSIPRAVAKLPARTPVFLQDRFLPLDDQRLISWKRAPVTSSTAFIFRQTPTSKPVVATPFADRILRDSDAHHLDRLSEIDLLCLHLVVDPDYPIQESMDRWRAAAEARKKPATPYLKEIPALIDFLSGKNLALVDLAYQGELPLRWLLQDYYEEVFMKLLDRMAQLGMTEVEDELFNAVDYNPFFEEHDFLARLLKLPNRTRSDQEIFEKMWAHFQSKDDAPPQAGIDCANSYHRAQAASKLLHVLRFHSLNHPDDLEFEFFFPQFSLRTVLEKAEAAFSTLGFFTAHRKFAAGSLLFFQ